jgi:hypothetical protein
LRAEDKIEIVKEDGKTVVRPKESLVGADGWIPICEKRLPFEATISLLLLQSAPGVPVPIKLERRHADLVPLDAQLDEDVGLALATWAAGAATKPGGDVAPATGPPPGSVASLADLKARARTAGISQEQLAAAKAGLFPGSEKRSLSVAELNQLWAQFEGSLVGASG